MPKCKVTKQMRTLYFEKFGYYADDKTIYEWYWSTKKKK